MLTKMWSGARARPSLFLASPNALGARGLDVGEADGDGVGGIRGRRFGEAKEGANHKSDLLLLSAAPADDGLLYPARCIFMDLQSSTGCGKKRHSARRAQDDCRAVTLDIDDIFYGHGCGTEFLNGGIQGIVDRDQAGALGKRGAIRDDAISQHLFAAGGVSHDGIACSPEGRIDGKEDVGGHDGEQAAQILLVGRNLFPAIF